MFETIVGNEKNKKTLEEIINNELVSHSYLFVGPGGVGKKEFAKEFAKKLLCEKDTTGKEANQFDTLNHPDYKLIEPDGNYVKIEQIRELVQKIHEKPIVSNKKVYIINDAEKMTTEASNALLKTLEEPPEYVTLILICTSESMLLNTIRSRCQKIVFQKLTKEEIERYFGQSFSDKRINIFDGSIKKAILTKDKTEIFEGLEEIFNGNTSLINFFEKSKSIYNNKEEIYDILEYIEYIFLEKLKKNKEETKVEKILNCIEQIEKTKRYLKSNANFEMSIDNLLFEIYKNNKL